MAAPDPQLHIATLQRELAWAHLKIQALQAELRQERILKYGPRSETLSDLQLKLLEEEPGVSCREVEAEAGRAPVPAFPSASARRIPDANACRKICRA